MRLIIQFSLYWLSCHRASTSADQRFVTWVGRGTANRSHNPALLQFLRSTLALVSTLNYLRSGVAHILKKCSFQSYFAPFTCCSWFHSVFGLWHWFWLLLYVACFAIGYCSRFCSLLNLVVDKSSAFDTVDHDFRSGDCVYLLQCRLLR